MFSVTVVVVEVWVVVVVEGLDLSWELVTDALSCGVEFACIIQVSGCLVCSSGCLKSNASLN